MKRSSRLTAGAMGLIVVLLVVALRAGEPPEKFDAVKPAWQRLLQGEDAKKAAEQETKLAQLQEAGQFPEALKVAEALAELRAKRQGADHSQAVDARLVADAIRRVLNAKPEERKSYSTVFAIKREVEALNAKGRYREAQPFLERDLSIHRKVLGEEHPLTAMCYNEVARNLYARGKYAEAAEVDSKALTIRRKVLGEDHPDTATSYNNVAFNLKAQGKYRQAEEGFEKALAIFRKVLGEEHFYTAASYNNVAYNLNAQGKYRQAEEGFEKALAVCRKVLGEENPYTAAGYNNVAANLSAQGKHRQAEEGLGKALAIRRKVLGEEHPDTAYSYDSVADNLNAQGKYRQAEEGYGKALLIRRKVLGEEHPDTAKSYNNVAASLNAQGKYRQAEEGFRRALAIYRKMLGEEHPDTAISYNNLAANLNAQGKYRQAEEGYGKALLIRRKVLGEEHPSTAASYNNVAANLNARGKYRQAEEGLEKALAIYRKVLGEEHPDTATGYNNVAYNLNAQGKYREAEEGYGKVLVIRRKVLGEEHPDTATSYNNLAANLNAQGKYRQAEEGFGKALVIRRKVLGEEHRDTAASYNNLALSLNAQGRYKEAEKRLLHAAESFAKARLHVEATGLERAAFTGEHSPLPVLAVVLARNGKPDDAWQCFEESLARGTWDDLSARLRRPQAERDKQAQITTQIDRLNKLIGKASVAKPTPQQSQRRDELLSQLRQAYEELADFTQQLEKKYGPIAGQILPRGQIQGVLPADAAFVAWIDTRIQPEAADPNGEHWVILMRSAGSPVWVRLAGTGEKNAWTVADTQLPGQLRAALQTAGSDWQPLAARLRKQRLDPLTEHLKGVQRLIVLPSTALAGVPLEVIADGYTVSYAHSGTMHAHLLRQPAPTGKGLLALADPVFGPPKEKDKPQPLPPSGVLLTVVLPGSNAAKAGLKPNDVLLRYGDTELHKPTDFKPQPESPESNDPKKLVPVVVWRDGVTRKEPFFVPPGKLGVVIAKEPAPQAVAEQRRINRLLASRSGDDGDWLRLPGTRIEASSLHRLFDEDAPVQILLDSDASEQRLNELAQRGALGSYRYVHLATHGEVNDAFPLRSAVILSRDHLPDDQRRTELLLSGQPIPDGRLEAEEALQRWDLHCDLVTLSACQTALGKYERGEGFVGFAQALILCGTRSVCLSLWKVSDTATALLMQRFYQNLLGKRTGLKAPMAKAGALAEAKRWLRTLPRGEAVKYAASLREGVSRGKGAERFAPLEMPPVTAKTEPDDHPFAHPVYWAAFILIGHAD